MKKLLALVLAMACALSLGIPTLAKTADVTWSQVNVEDFVDENGEPVGTDEDNIRPGQTIYWVFGSYSDYDYLLDDKMVKIDVDKDEGSKNIDGKPKVTSKKLSDYKDGSGRYIVLEIKVKDTYTADELKTKLDIYITAKKDLYATNAGSGKFPIYKDNGTITSVTPDELNNLKQAVTDAKAEQTKREDELKETQSKIDAITPAKTTWTTWEASRTIGGVTTSYKEIAADPDKYKNAYNTANQNLTDAQTQLDTLKGADTVDGSILFYEKAMTTANGAAGTALDGQNYAAADGKTYTVNLPVDFATAITEWKVTATADGSAIKVGDDETLTTNVTNAVSAAKNDYDTAKGKKDTADERLATLEGTGDDSITVLTNKAAAAKATSDAFDEAIASAEYTNAKAAIEAAPAKDYASLSAVEAALAPLNTKKDTLNGTGAGSIAEAKQAVADKEKALKAAEEGDKVGTGYLKKGDTMKVPMTIWIQNENRVDDDATFVAGEKGVVIKPVKNEENTVTWEDNNDTLAIMKFTADSDVEYYMPRMATKWNNEDYLDYFDDMDAYIRSFVGNPSIPCTSRARLWINNPFVDDDGEETIDPDDIYVYEVVDGELYDITDKVEYTTNDDDDYAFLIKTRTLGTYIFSDGPADIEDEDDDDYDPEAPDKVEVNNNKKPVPPTGF
ncbi:hypothetical protein [Anaerotruncus rubiinfantis]|uniref:hypothetical protein n=1 Tax=Anaerotruncus rubiinfantis TaxID=1720200 RepID=UPI00082DCC21|nr:hypothetical protein [Anaerotruncus rubiinfantis]